MENIKQCEIAIGLLCLSNQEKKTAKFAVQVCGSKKSFAVAKVQKITANLRICDCGPPITILRNLRLWNRVQICGAQHCWKAFQLQRSRAKKYCTGRTVSLALHQRRNYHLSFSLILLIETLLSVLQQHLFLGQIGWTNNQKINRY